MFLFLIDFPFFFLVFNNVAYHTLRSTTFLLFDLSYWYLVFLFINLFEFTVHGYVLPVTLTFEPMVKLLFVIWKYCILLITFFSLGLDFNIWHVPRLNQVNWSYAIMCDLDLLLQYQVIYNLNRKYISWHAFPGTPVFSTNTANGHDILKYCWK